MTAGKGIMHAELPRPTADGRATIGMQLWVDLPTKLKDVEPRYRDLRESEIPNLSVDDGKVLIKLISGKSYGVDSAKDLAYTSVWILDVEIKPGGTFSQAIPENWNAFAYTLEGATDFVSSEDETTIYKYHTVVFDTNGDSISAKVAADATEGSRFGKYSSQLNIGIRSGIWRMALINTTLSWVLLTGSNHFANFFVPQFSLRARR
jgi:redox-sensitive bicupin YhaK (pirin superfamily)